MHTEEELQAIRNEAKLILDSFHEAIQDVDDDLDVGLVRDRQLRKPSAQNDPEFKQRMLANAPKKDADYIYAEKKSW